MVDRKEFLKGGCLAVQREYRWGSSLVDQLAPQKADQRGLSLVTLKVDRWVYHLAGWWDDL